MKNVVAGVQVSFIATMLARIGLVAATSRQLDRRKSTLLGDPSMSAWLGRIGFFSFAAAVTWLLLDSPGTLHSQTTIPKDDADITVVSTMLPTGTQQIVVVDTRQTTMAVYHVEPAQGKIQLKSVRNLVWDLRMEQFNAQAPLPSELRQVQP